MTRTRHLTREEQQLWQRFTQDMRPMHENEPSAVADPSVTLTAQPVTTLPSASLTTMPAKAGTTTYDLHPGDTSGVDRRSIQRIRRGKLTPEATLDLHGYSQADAMHQFQLFIRHAVEQGIRLIRVITGHGKMRDYSEAGILRQALPRWVNLPENRRYIINYENARPQEGGAGAWLILLRRKERLS